MNKSENTKKTIRLIISVIILLTVLIIWGHSFMTPEMSTEESSFVKEIVEAVVQSVSNNEAFTIPEIVIRKSAHFIEYAILGLELVILITINKSLQADDDKKRGLIKKLLSLYPTAFIISLLVGFVDETIQYFTGRYSSIWDVLLDLTGASFSILIFLLLRTIFLRRKR
ncbi:MAG: VanZ family protein [Lachnospiraceae bacterium]|nr:VanZ family protein [Lachnospiraceae bacterium]